MIGTKVIETRLMPRSRYLAITLFGLVFTRQASRMRGSLLRHELIHCQQQLEWAYIPFYILYAGEWLWHLARLRNRHAAYMAVSFEREAYDNEDDPAYLQNRKPYANFRRHQ